MRKIIVGVLMLLSMSVSGAVAPYAPGDRVEIFSARKWHPGVVRAVKGDQYKVGFDGYDAAWDAWVAADKLRKSAAAAMAAPTVAVPIFKRGDRVEGMTFGMWFSGTVVEMKGGQVRVKYDDGTEGSLPADRVRPDPVKGSLAQPVATTRAAGAKAGLEGAFLRVESFFMGTSVTLSNQAWFFTKDGKFSRAPTGGFSFDGFTPTRATDGTYSIAGGKLTLAYADGSKPLVHDFVDKGDELKWGGVGASRVAGFKKGWRLDGEYEGGASIGGGAMMSSSTLVFRRDGTFARAAVGSFNSTSDRSTVSGGSRGEAAGTYEFDGFTLRLEPKGGAAASYTVFAFGDVDSAGRPEYIYRDGAMMKRQDRK